ncbi:MAG: hypothetical protein HWE27_10525 [Gammaproteobacteria bacterium]|nr:hypothetical protein [Gammaproteobacteria bacterium]
MTIDLSRGKKEMLSSKQKKASSIRASVVSLAMVAALSGCSSDKNSGGSTSAPEGGFKLTLSSVNACGDLQPNANQKVIFHSEDPNQNRNSIRTEFTTNGNGEIVLNDVSGLLNFSTYIETNSSTRAWSFIGLEAGTYNLVLGLLSEEQSTNCSCDDYIVTAYPPAGYLSSDINGRYIAWGSANPIFSQVSDTQYEVSHCGSVNQPLSVTYRLSDGNFAYGVTTPSSSTNLEIYTETNMGRLPFPSYSINTEIEVNRSLNIGEHFPRFYLSESSTEYDNLSGLNFPGVYEFRPRQAGTLNIDDDYFPDQFSEGFLDRYKNIRTSNEQPQSLGNMIGTLTATLINTSNFEVEFVGSELDADVSVMSTIMSVEGGSLSHNIYRPASERVVIPYIDEAIEAKLENGMAWGRFYRNVEVVGANNFSEALSAIRFDNDNVYGYPASYETNNERASVYLTKTVANQKDALSDEQKVELNKAMSHILRDHPVR